MSKLFLLFVLLYISNIIIVGADEQPSAKFATVCITPNNDVGFCTEIQNCNLFMEILTSARSESYDFLRASRCGSANDNPKRPRVCCGIHTDYVDKPTTTVKLETTTILRKQIAAGNMTEGASYPLPAICGKQQFQLPSRIFGGITANLGEFPWMARLRHRRRDGLYFYGCVGFLISEYFVLTAAHCILSNALGRLGSVHEVELGEHNTETDPDCRIISRNESICANSTQLIRVRRPKVHPEYSNNVQHYNDIAVVPLKNPAKLSDYVFPICLARHSSEENEMWVSGWGRTETAPNSPVKLKVMLPRAKHNDCSDKYKEAEVILLNSQLCAGGQEGQDSCSGDSGGPLMIQEGIGPWYAEGIVSFGMKCGQEDWPGVYTSIPEYIPWIKKIMTRYIKKHKITLSL